MGAIDWNLIRSPTGNPSEEIGTIRGMLASIAEGRERRAIQEQQMAFQRQQHADLLRNQEEDNRRADTQMGILAEQAKATAAFNQKKFDTEQEQKRREALEKIREPLGVAIRNKDPRADLIASSAGFKLNRRTEDPPPPPPDPLEGVRDIPFVNRRTGWMGLINQAIPKSTEPPPLPVEKYDLTDPNGPEGNVLATLDPFEIQQAEIAAQAEKRRIANETVKGAVTDPVAADVANQLTMGDVDAPKATEKAIEIAERRRLEAAKNAARGRGKNPNDPRLTNIKDDNTRADVGAFETAYGRWESQGNVDKLTDAYDKFTEMRADVQAFGETGDVIAQRAAMYNAARIITGPGVLTQAEFDNTVQRTGGLIASALSKAKKMEDGTISDAEADAIAKFVENANTIVHAKAIRALRNFDLKFKGGHHDSKVPGEVARARAALISRFGIDESELAPKVRLAPEKRKQAAAMDPDR